MKTKYPDPKLNQVFGLLRCIGVRTHKGKNGNWKFQMQCECGGITSVSKFDLFNRGYHSCGCTRKDAMRGPPGEVSYAGLYDSCKQGAKARNMLFALSKEEHRSIVVQDCTYCGKKPAPYNFYVKIDGTLRRTNKDARQSSIDLSWVTANGVDRIDNSIGYVMDNCVPCCKVCNIAKAQLSAQEFIAHFKAMVLFQKRGR